MTLSQMFCTAMAVSGVSVRGLPDDGVAADGRDGRVPGPDGDGKVERGDDADRPERMPLLEHAVPGPLAGDRQAVELPRETDGEIAHVDHLLDFAQPFRPDLAGFERDQHPQVVFGVAERISQLADDFAVQCGMEISDFLPHIAEHADDLCLLRGCYGDSVTHPESVYLMNTGTILMGQPSLGAWATYGLGTENQNMPAFVVMPDPVGLGEGRRAGVGQRLSARDLSGHDPARRRVADPESEHAARRQRASSSARRWI